MTAPTEAKAPCPLAVEQSDEWKMGFAAGCDAVMAPALRVTTAFHYLEESIRSLKPQSDVVGGPEQYGFMRGIEAVREEIRRVERTYRYASNHAQPGNDVVTDEMVERIGNAHGLRSYTSDASGRNVQHTAWRFTRVELKAALRAALAKFGGAA